jgi:hypothetical protein
MAKRPMLPPATLGKPSKKSKYSNGEEPEEDDEEEGCSCDHEEEEKGIMLKLSILLPSALQPK